VTSLQDYKKTKKLKNNTRIINLILGKCYRGFRKCNAFWSINDTVGISTWCSHTGWPK